MEISRDRRGAVPSKGTSAGEKAVSLNMMKVISKTKSCFFDDVTRVNRMGGSFV